jgi:hypothetical protein
VRFHRPDKRTGPLQFMRTRRGFASLTEQIVQLATESTRSTHHEQCT